MVDIFQQSEEGQNATVYQSSFQASDILDIDAGTGITFDMYKDHQVIRVRSATSGACDITADPQIETPSSGNPVVEIHGTDDTRTVQLDDGDGLTLINGSVILGNENVLVLRYIDGTWIQIAPELEAVANIDNTVYGAAWGGSTNAPTQDRVYDKIEAVQAEIDALEGGVVNNGNSIDNTIVRFDGTTGDVIQGSEVYISDGNVVSNVAELTLANGASVKDEVYNAYIQGRTGVTAQGQNAGIYGGDSDDNVGGDAYLQGGVSTSDDGGNVYLTPGKGGGESGSIILSKDTDAEVGVFLDLDSIATTNKTITIPNASGTLELEGHTHTASEVSDFDTEVSNNSDVAANTSARHSHSNKVLLDSYDQSNADITSAVSLKHAATLVGTKTVDETDIGNGKMLAYNSTSGKLEYETPSGGVSSVNTLTGAVTLTQDNIGDGTTYKQYSDTEKTKLSGIEAAADVTDAGNVGSTIHGATAKTTPADDDTTALIDSAASNVLKKLSWSNIKTTLKTYFDSLYAASAKGVTNGDTHDHSGGDGAQIDHGGLAGLSDDDHSQYSLVAGTRAFTGKVSYNAHPTFSADTEIVDKKYVDDTVSGAGGYTDEQAQDAVGGMLVDTATIDLTYTDATPELKADVKDGSITYAKIQDVSATDKLLGRVTAGSGDIEEVSCTAFARSILDDANEATFKATVNLEIGTDVQAYNAGLADIAGLAKTDSNIIVGNGTNWVAETGATARTSLGLGSLATLSSVNNSNWSGTDLSVANGGTGASTLTGILKGNGTSAVTAVTAPSGALVGDTDTQTLTNKTLTSPKIGTSILDTNGNELMLLTATASAVNEVTLANAATGGSPTLSATGGDTNIDLVLLGKGTGSVYTSNDLYVGAKTLSTATCSLSIGNGRTGDGFSLIDLIGDATYTDYGFRIIRLNGGANTATRLLHRGTGDFDIWGEEASNIRFLTSGGVKLTIGAAITVDSAFNYAADAQASDTYVITLSPALTAYVAGQQIIFKANTANTGAASINVNGLGAKTIVKRVNTTLANSDILAGMFCHLVYDGTNFVLLNPVVN